MEWAGFFASFVIALAIITAVINHS